MTNLKFGRRPPKNAPALRLAPLLTGVVPAHPIAQDNLADLAGWEVLGNDVAGDCVAVTWANFRRLVTVALAEKERYPSQDDVWTIYKTQNPDFDPNGSDTTNGPGSNADQGMDIQTLLEYLVKTGGPDSVKPVAFAKVDHTNLEEVKAAIAIFGGVWTGINVLAANMAQFDHGQPWDYVAGSPVDGGHSILSAGYKGSAGSDVTFITWGEETSFTDAFLAHEAEEMWVVIWPEHFGAKAFTQGVNLQTLAADYQALTGRVLPIPAPTPAPAPAPFPPTPVPVTPVQPPVIPDGATFPLDEVDPWLNGKQYTHKGRRAQQAIDRWLRHE